MAFVLSLLLAFAGHFSGTNALERLHHLAVEIGPRPMGSPAEQAALAYAVSEFRRAGCETAWIMPMTTPGGLNTTSGIAVGIKRGASARSIVIGGHVDSEGPEVPGADDDGSGAVTVMELASVLCARPHQSTLVFCCFGGEERGLYGSRHFVASYPGLDSVALMLQIDMANGLGVIDLDPDSYGGSAPRWLVRAAIGEFARLGYTGLRYPTHFFSMNYAFPAGSGSDHESFLDAGIPAIDFSTDVAKPIHTPRDNFANFEPGGLERTGRVMESLVERFDAGVPSSSASGAVLVAAPGGTAAASADSSGMPPKRTERYWLYLVGTTPFFVPMSAVWAFAGVAILAAVGAFVTVRRRRLDHAADVKWTTVRMIAFTLVVAACGWFSSDLVGFLKGLRHPWYTAVDLYVLQGFLGAAIGGWLILRLRPRLSACPYVHFKRAAIALAILMGLGAALNPKLLVEPAAGLLLLSLAMLVRPAPLRFLLAAAAPIWVLRLVFSEWEEILFRTAGAANTVPLLKWAAANGILLFLFLFLLFPFFSGMIAVIRDAPPLLRLFRRLAGWAPAAGLLAVYAVLTVWLIAAPVYNTLWQRDLRVSERIDVASGTPEFTIRSSEYLKGLTVRHGGSDTLLTGRDIMATIPPKGTIDTGWVYMTHLRKDSTGATIRIDAPRRPYAVTISYACKGKALRAFSSPWNYRSDASKTVLRWEAFPAMPLVVPVSFNISAEGGPIEESVEVEFDSLIYPMTLLLDSSYVIPRTIFKLLEQF